MAEDKNVYLDYHIIIKNEQIRKFYFYKPDEIEYEYVIEDDGKKSIELMENNIKMTFDSRQPVMKHYPYFPIKHTSVYTRDFKLQYADRFAIDFELERSDKMVKIEDHFGNFYIIDDRNKKMVARQFKDRCSIINSDLETVIITEKGLNYTFKHTVEKSPSLSKFAFEEDFYSLEMIDVDEDEPVIRIEFKRDPVTNIIEDYRTVIPEISKWGKHIVCHDESNYIAIHPMLVDLNIGYVFEPYQYIAVDSKTVSGDITILRRKILKEPWQI